MWYTSVKEKPPLCGASGGYRMKEKMGSLPVTAAALVCALLGLSLRAAGRSGRAGALIAVSACVTLAAAVYALLVQKERDYACVFEKSLFDAAASCLGALLIGVGCALEALNGAGAGRYIAVLGVLSALALIRAAALRWSGRKPGAGWFAPMIVYYLAKLFFDYRQWMLDPAILDYCFMLFAMLLFLLASYYAAVFSFDRGGRRMLLFSAAGGVYFGAVSIPGADLAHTLLFAGSILCLLAYLWQAATVKTPAPEEPAQPDAQEGK